MREIIFENKWVGGGYVMALQRNNDLEVQYMAIH